MNDRFRNEANRRESPWRERDRSGESGWREANRSGPRDGGPQYSSDEDETYGSEWNRDRGQGSSLDRGDDDRGNVGYGGSSFGQDRGNYAGGYGQDRGTYRGPGGGNFGQNRGSQGGGNFGSGAGYGSGGYGQQRGFGSGFHQGYRGRDVSGPGADLNRSRDVGSSANDWRTIEPRGGGHAGRGPKGYTRTDERIREDVCERLSQDDDVDASEIEVSVKGGEVTLLGTVLTRRMKHDAEDIAENVSGVTDVHNQLRVLKGVISELKDKLTGDEEPERHFAGGGTKSA